MTDRLDVTLAALPDGADFYMAPIPLGYYRYTDLLDGSLSIEHLAEINDAMAYDAENRARANEAAARARAVGR